MKGAGRVLIVDDDELVARVLASHVRAAGYDVRATADPQEFIELAQTWNPTHVCVDLVMGDTDGLELLTQLAALNSHAAVIITSGMGPKVLDAAREFAAASGLAFTTVLAKPFSRSDVALVLSNVPERRGAEHKQVDLLAEWPRETFAVQLAEAVATNQLFVVYQPKVSCVTGEVVGFEALARWAHPTIGTIPPTAFVPRAESVGLVSVITGTVTEQALSWFARYRSGTQERISINISGSELSDREGASRLRSACTVAGVDPSRVTLELTETAALDDATTSLEVLTRLRLEGFHLSIDDFGTGYSSMVNLQNLPFDELKIDRSFVVDCATNRASAAIVRSAITLARDLGLEVTAEGVEDAAAFELIRSMGCDFAQGYAIAKPLGDAEVRKWLASR